MTSRSPKQAASQVLSLAMFPELSPEQQERVVPCAAPSTGTDTSVSAVSEAGTVVVVGLGELGKPLLEFVSRH